MSQLARAVLPATSVLARRPRRSGATSPHSAALQLARHHPPTSVDEIARLLGRTPGLRRERQVELRSRLRDAHGERAADEPACRSSHFPMACPFTLAGRGQDFWPSMLMRAAIVTFPGLQLRARPRRRAGAPHSARPCAASGTRRPSCRRSTWSACPAASRIGDYLRCGAIAARSPVMREVIAAAPSAAPACSASATASRC